MGAVYLAMDTQLGRRVALKVPKKHRVGGEEARERFLREARAAASLRHPNLCSVFDVGEVDGVPFIALEYVEGRPLSRFVAEERPTVDRVVELVETIARAMHAAHVGGVVHRDLKPENVMVTPEGQPIVMDFGLARHDESGDLRATLAGRLMGTPAYMSPEQIEGDPTRIGPVSDQFSLGVMLFEMLTGELPHRAGSIASMLAKIVAEPPPSPRSLTPRIEPTLDAICLRTLAKEPEERFGSMAELAEALRRMRESGPAGTGPTIDRRKEDIEKALAAGEFDRALDELQVLEQLSGASEWIEARRTEARLGQERARRDVLTLVQTARQLLERGDDRQAIQLLEEVPPEHRSDEVAELVESARRRTARLAELKTEVAAALAPPRPRRLRELRRELREIAPTSGLTRQVERTLDGRRTSPPRKSKRRRTTATAPDTRTAREPGVEGDERRPVRWSIFKGSSKSMAIVVVVVAPLTWGLLHLLWALPSILWPLERSEDVETVAAAEVGDPDLTAPRRPLPRVRPLDELNTPEGDERAAWLSSDGLTIYWWLRPTVGAESEIWTATRPDFDSRFTNKRRLMTGEEPTLTADELEMIYRPGSDKDLELHVAVRRDSKSPFGPPTKVRGLDFGGKYNPQLSPDGLQLVVESGGREREVLQYLRRSRDEPWTTPTFLSSKLPATYASGWRSPILEPDGLALWGTIIDDRYTGGGARSYRATRRNVDHGFENVEPVEFAEAGPEIAYPRPCEASGELFFVVYPKPGDLWVARDGATLSAD